MPRLIVEQWETEHRRHVDEYINEIDELYEEATDELVSLGMSYSYDPTSGKTFAFSSEKLRGRAANEIVSSLNSRLRSIIYAGIIGEWAFANEKVDSWVKKLFSEPKEGYMLHNIAAMEAYQRRKTYGHTLSDRVWNYAKQHQQQIELALSVGITEGRSASGVSRDVRHLLNNPDNLYRRVRDQYGNLVLSKAAQAYHPGQGVYRSSYQNAMRLARTEINGAYRESDYTRWNQLDFIVGVEIKPSKSHEAWLAKDWVPRFRNIATVIDGVNDGSYEKVSDKVFKMRKQTGKRVRADYVSLDTDLSVKLAQIRADKTGREVPLKFIKDNNREISKLIPKLIDGKVFDELYLWDTNINGTPRLILSQINGVLKIEDMALYERFLKKAN